MARLEGGGTCENRAIFDDNGTPLCGLHHPYFIAKRLEERKVRRQRRQRRSD